MVGAKKNHPLSPLLRRRIICDDFCHQPECKLGDLLKRFCRSSAKREAKRLGDDLHLSYTLQFYFTELIHLFAFSLNWKRYLAFWEKDKEEHWKRSCIKTEVQLVIDIIFEHLINPRRLNILRKKLESECHSFSREKDGG